MSFFTVDPFRELMHMHSNMERMHRDIFGGGDEVPDLAMIVDSERPRQREKTELQGRKLPLASSATPAASTSLQPRLWAPRWNVRDDEKQIVIHADLPGCQKENLKVEVKDGILTLSGERKSVVERRSGGGNAENAKGGAGGDCGAKDGGEASSSSGRPTWYVRECSSGKFLRSLRLPENADEDRVAAKFTDGVLEVTVPKLEPPQSASSRMIDIN